MRLIETTEAMPFIGRNHPFREWGIRFSQAEIAILEQALEILSKAGDLQTEGLRRSGAEDDGSDNPYEWAAIHLRQIELKGGER